MNNDSKIKKLFAKIKEKKHLEIVIAVIAVTVMLILYFSTKVGSPDKKESNVTASANTSDYCSKTEADLEEALQSMKGVGKTKVVINWESGVETVIAYATNTSGNSVSATPTIVQTQGSSSPLVLKELYPQALGVIIICQGGDNIATKLDVVNMASVFLNIPQSKINVYAMK